MIVELLRNKGLKVTPQRIAILNCLEMKIHPTVDEVYHNVLRSHPSISLATVYKNLNAMYEEGIVKQVNTGKMIRYDLAHIVHIHTVCKKCHNVTDHFPHEKSAQEIFSHIGQTIKGSTIEGCDITVFTVCPSCL